jgi:hypothetical protein
MRIDQALAPYFAVHRSLRVDPEARNPKHTSIERGEVSWRVRQVLLDPEEDNDWFFEVIVDLGRSREAARPILALDRVGT